MLLLLGVNCLIESVGDYTFTIAQSLANEQVSHQINTSSLLRQTNARFLFLLIFTKALEIYWDIYILC